MAAPAYAQDEQTEPSAGPVENEPSGVEVSAQGEDLADEGDEAIIVTGSRIPQPNLTAVSPVTVVNSAEIKLQGTTRTEDLINSLPQAFADQGSNIANGATGTATVNLRGLGAERTLVLVNGRRLLPGDPTSSAADINAIPAGIVQRVDVLTGGASSVYGADAVAGVVNFVMDTDFDGFRIDGQYSFYQHNNGTDQRILDGLDRQGFGYPGGSVADGGTVNVDVAFGTDFADGRGHIMAYAGYRKVNAVLQGNRDYASCVIAPVLADPTTLNCGGSATSHVGTFFTNTGVFQIGPNRTFVPGATLYNFGPTNHYQRPDERYTFGAFAEYEINESIQPYLEIMFMDDKTGAQIAPSGNFGNTFLINCGAPGAATTGANPLLSAQQAAIACDEANLVTSPDGSIDADADPFEFVDPTTGEVYTKGLLQILRRNVEGGPRQDTLQHTSFRVVGGARGEISDALSYDAYYLFGRTNFAETYLNDFSVVRLGRALDVIDDPNQPGINPICRTFLSAEDPNCVPYDIFATGAVTEASVNYLSTPGFQRGLTEQRVASASVTALLGEYGIQSPWANEGVGVNVGAEYRKERLDLQTDVAFQTGDLSGQGAATLPVSGEYDVKELFGEVRIPIITDSFIENLSFEAGYRYSAYDAQGNTFSTDSYKLGVEFAPVRDIRFRASYNRAVRAPNIQELFAPQRVVLNGNFDPCEGTNPEATQAQCALTGLPAAQYGRVQPNPAGQYNGLIGGNPDLLPEKATTMALGVVLQPRFLPGFAATVDWFDIEIKDAIQGIGQDVIIQTCIETGDPLFCGLIQRDQFGSLWRANSGFVRDLQQNVGGFSTTGIDVGLSYSTEIGNAGTVGFNMQGTWLDELVTDNGVSEPYDCAGLYGAQFCGTPNPEWRHRARLTYTHPSGLGISLQWRYFGGVDNERLSDQEQLQNDVAEFNARIKSQSYFDLAGTFRVSDNYAFRIGVNNIFDREPPLVGSSGGGAVNQCPAGICSGNTFAQVYDALGRYIYAGVTLDF
ncbi:MAG TPA: TonB-dependent receptor [Allosphingosinicella sp.]|nr:TonB-dependent receptor [Allosphingosinicella sp.]